MTVSRLYTPWEVGEELLLVLHGTVGELVSALAGVHASGLAGRPALHRGARLLACFATHKGCWTRLRIQLRMHRSHIELL